MLFSLVAGTIGFKFNRVVIERFFTKVNINYPSRRIVYNTNSSNSIVLINPLISEPFSDISRG